MIKTTFNTELFWSKVERTDNCYLWTGALASGYGVVRFENKVHQATHVAWFLAYGILPPINCEVCHTCDNKACVRIEHLFLGTKSQNATDRESKHREDHRRLSLDEAAEIRKSYAPGLSRQLSQKYHVSQETILDVIHNNIYITRNLRTAKQRDSQ